MSAADYSLTIFVALNVARAIAYWPQIVSIYRDPGYARAVSLWTWIVFTTANVATVVYALAGLEDHIVAAVFGVNAIGCASIVMFTAHKRCRDRLPLWRNIFAGLWHEPDCQSSPRERGAIAAAPRKARAMALRLFSRWRAARWAAHQRQVQYIAGKGPFTIE